MERTTRPTPGNSSLSEVNMAEQKNPETTIDEELCEDDFIEEFPSPKKKSWPELVGLTGEEAEKKIQEEMIFVDTEVLPYGRPVTCDLCDRRVQIFVNSAGIVVETPLIG